MLFRGRKIADGRLPRTRKALFFEQVKAHFVQLILLGGLLFLFAIPIHSFAILEELYMASLYGELGEGITPEQEVAAQYLSLQVRCVRGLINIPCLMLFSVGLSGAMRVICRHGWGEPVRFFPDFWKGIRENWKQMLAFSAVVGIVGAVTQIAYSNSTLTSDVTAFIMLFPVVIFLVVLLPVFGFMGVAISVYNSNMKMKWTLCLSMFVGNPLRTLLTVYGSLIIFFPLLIPDISAHLLGRMVATVLSPVVMLAWTLFTFNQMDVTVNYKEFPELVDKGLEK